MQQPPTKPEFLLGDVQVFTSRGLLRGPTKSIQLEPKVMGVLQALAKKPGEVISRDNLQQIVWGDTVVSDDAITRCIYQLRRDLASVLSNEHDDPIETLRKRGYRLTIPVHPGLETAVPPEADRPSSMSSKLIGTTAVLMVIFTLGWHFSSEDPESRTRLDSIAVLPFLNLTGDDEFDYLADGFSEQLAHVLANVDGLKVAARTSAFYFKNRDAEIPDIAERLKVNALLEGSIRLQGAKLRVTVQLVRDDGFHIWSREYDRPMSATVQLQSEIAERVLAELGKSDRAEFERIYRQPTDNYAAYDLYIRGRQSLLPGKSRSYDNAIDLFQQAIALDAEYALAYSGLADANSLKVSAGMTSAHHVDEVVSKAIDMAISLDSELAQAYASRGLFHFVKHEYVESVPHLLKAIELNPNYVNAHSWLGLALVYQDRFKEAIDAYRQAQSLNPLDVSINRNLGANLLLAGFVDEGLSYLRRVQEILPDDLQTYRLLASWNLNYGRVEQALNWSNRGLMLSPDDARQLRHSAAALAFSEQWQAAAHVLLKARQSAPDDVMVLDSYLSVLWAGGDLAKVEEVIEQQATVTSEFNKTLSHGMTRTLLRWKMIVALGTNNIDTVLALANSPAAKADLLCGSFGHPGPQMYWAYALALTNQNSRAERLMAQCIQDSNRVLANGGNNPIALLRSALSLAHAGQTQKAAEALEQAVSLGWGTRWEYQHDPLWVPFSEEPSISRILHRSQSQDETLRARLRSFEPDIR